MIIIDHLLKTYPITVQLQKINDLTGKKQKEGIPFLNAENGVKIFDDYGKCSLLNDYFAQQSHLNDTGVVTPPVTLLTENFLDTMCFTPIDVQKVIKGLNISKAIGNIFIKRILPIMCNDLTILFNYSIDNEVYPSQWKSSNVIPVFKKGEKTRPQNYRPISLLCCISKVFERLVSDKVMKYINTIMDVVAAKKGGEFGFNLWARKCAECLKFMT
jgi:sarcosine oxidase/L-pipecolate oxidase